MVLNSRQFKFLKNYRNSNVKSSAKREYRDENVFLKGDRALSKLITLSISNKIKLDLHFLTLNKWTDRQADRQTDRQIDRHFCETSIFGFRGSQNVKM